MSAKLPTKEKTAKPRIKEKGLLRNSLENWELLIMALPVVILLIMFNYIPMAGSVIAFKDFNFKDGIFGSPWSGFDNFKFLFTMWKTTWRMLRNTLGYYVLGTVTGTVANVVLALALNECRKKYFAKISQTFMILPTFISYMAVTFIVECFLDYKNGMMNHLLIALGKDPIQWYMEAKWWPHLYVIVSIWKGTGYGAIMYLAALAGMDQEVFEAAELDGATKMQQIRYITLPMLTSMICILTLLGLGGCMHSNTGFFYQVTKDSPMLYETTQTIDTYVLNAMLSGNSTFGPAAAVSLFQSVVGCLITVVVNFICRKVSPENALF